MTRDDEPACLLVCGSTGLLGTAVVRAGLARGWRVLAVVRNLNERRASVSASLCVEGKAAEVIEGDVTAPNLGLAPADAARARDATYVINASGRFVFGAVDADIRSVNLDGAVAVARFAATIPHLEAFAHVGGYRVAAASHAGRIGAYERSKQASVAAVSEVCAELGVPLVHLHPCGVIGDSRTGETSQLTGIGETLHRLFDRSLPALVGGPRTWIPLVCSDDFAEVTLAALAERGRADQNREHFVLDERTPKLPELVEMLAVHLGVRAPGWSVPKAVVRVLPAAVTGVEAETLSFVDDCDYPTESAEALRRDEGIVRPPFEDSLARWVDHLVATRFLQEPGRRGRMLGGTYVGALGSASSAPSTVLLHGLPFEHSSWQPLVEELGISALSPDLPGMGRSGHGAPTGEWLGELLDRAGLDSVTLVSHSLGCVPAMELAVRSPERVRGLVLISPFFAQARAGWILRCSMSGRVLLNAVSEDRLERSLFTSRNPSTARAVEAAKRSLTRNGVPANVARLLATASGVAERKRLRSLADRIRVPTLVVHGSDDLLRYPLPFRTHAVVGAGHAPHLEAAARVAAIIRRLDTGRVTVPGVAEEHR